MTGPVVQAGTIIYVDRVDLTLKPGSQTGISLLEAIVTRRLPDAKRDRLLRDRIVVLNTEINDGVATRVCQQLLTLANEDPAADISLYINSHGGKVEATLAIYETIRFIKPDVSTWGVNLATGCAQMILSSGARGKRYLLSHAQVQVKRPWIDASGLSNSETVECIQTIFKMISGDTGQSVRQLDTDADRRWFSAQDALRYGLVDQVVTELSCS